MEHRSLAEWNGEGVRIVVEPGNRIPTADSIEDVIVIRGGIPIRAEWRVFREAKLQNLMGAEITRLGGTFQFPLSAFAPSSTLVIRLIGKATTFEWTIPTAELERMK